MKVRDEDLMKMMYLVLQLNKNCHLQKWRYMKIRWKYLHCPEEDDVLKPSDRAAKFWRNDKSGDWNSPWRFLEEFLLDDAPEARVFCFLGGFSPRPMLIRSISRAFKMRLLAPWSLLKTSNPTSKVGPLKGSVKSLAGAKGWVTPRGRTSKLVDASSSSSVRSSLRRSPEGQHEENEFEIIVTS